jgi:hypothetical protein
VPKYGKYGITSNSPGKKLRFKNSGMCPFNQYIESFIGGF